VPGRVHVALGVGVQMVMAVLRCPPQLTYLARGNNGCVDDVVQGPRENAVGEEMAIGQ